MDAIGPFKDYLRKFIDLTDAEFEQVLLPVIKVRKFGKKELLTKAGDVENYFNFIIKGLIRKYYQKGRHEINTQISTEGHIIHCQESYHSRQPSEYFIETIEPSVVVSITYNDLESIFAQSKKMEHLGRLVITHTMVLKDRWQIQLVKMTPRERFLTFVTKNPELMQRVPQKFLASYLNIKPETFSRFKHLIKGHVRNVHSI
ncbi:MAG: Crp/Fnr family transcriptional regulator [Chitinophagaceae bacterium]|jgi:CRP-like cAMP-binding protein|nr:Crp/Fnr family transcriptional regulator [Chitinophagaceae bacterium]MBK7679106.1 Crp/Fnr family transcriptional regulator [Chitinophagaceae bacterium]MBK8299549.1 Crp/Fnr family transcriptional regulator [Chitinophagaceae bacterium]MBK9463599.1 Crp/Fnr family transcriptional regulator [Chitinophagaceae bacterium]MBK9659280.1 Crp/Fnr family transcriptional regulator [Chitinophagaceae bacterium]